MRSRTMASISAYCMAVLMAMSWRSAEAVSDHLPLSAPSKNFTVRWFSPIFSTCSYKSSGKRKCSTTRSGTDAGKATFPTYVFSMTTASTGIGSLIFRYGNILVEETQLKLSGKRDGGWQHIPALDGLRTLRFELPGLKLVSISNVH